MAARSRSDTRSAPAARASSRRRCWSWSGGRRLAPSAPCASASARVLRWRWSGSELGRTPMVGFDENTATALVLERLEGCPSPRLKEVMTSLVTHLHAVVKEVEPTPAEWFAAIQFLTRTGQICDG